MLVGSNFPRTHPVALSPGLLSGTDPVNNASNVRTTHKCLSKTNTSARTARAIVGWLRERHTTTSDSRINEPLHTKQGTGSMLVSNYNHCIHPVAIQPQLWSHPAPVNNDHTTARRISACRKQALQHVQPGQSLVGYASDTQRDPIHV